MEKINMTVFTSEKDIATKFYTKIIGLNLVRSSNSKILMKGTNYTIKVEELN